MKYNDAEKVMSKVEEILPDSKVVVESKPGADGPDDAPTERTYAVKVKVGEALEGGTLESLVGVAEDVVCKLRVAPSIENGPLGLNVRFD